ncbi:MAG: uroporphyrinogen-III C-methyltransferase [Chitinispirillaceae bacterium]|nr:uroporphyrinogen-III C-methyltransferase [Chitinispirillaceae bacterium]
MKDKKGFVYLIGAGPGDPELLTLKAKKKLEECDVVIYDALVNESIIASLPLHIRKIFVGKRGGVPSTSQSEINKLILREARKGYHVARLKGGDPLVFGRGSEEMEYLKENGIEYEVIPGISSAIAAPEYVGIPLTHRNISRSFAIATGHLQEGDDIDKLEIPIADTVVFLMAVENLPIIVEKLIATGKFTKNTPAALVYKGTFSDQKQVIGNLSNIVSLKEKYNITPPSVFIVGETVKFSKKLSWFKLPPLSGVRVGVLRATEQSYELISQLSSLGATVLPYPVICIKPNVRELKKINSKYLKDFTMLIFTSPNGGKLFMEHLINNGGDARVLANKKIYAMGEGTAAELLKWGIRVDAHPKKFVAEEILKIIPSQLKGEKILIPRAAIARELLPDELRKRGAEVTVLPVYYTEGIVYKETPFKDGDYILFTSSSTVKYFYENKQNIGLKIIPCCIGEITASSLKEYFSGEIFVAKNATLEEIINTLKRAVKINKGKKNGRS